jgi:hypothetical protein
MQIMEDLTLSKPILQKYLDHSHPNFLMSHQSKIFSKYMSLILAKLSSVSQISAHDKFCGCFGNSYKKA